MSVDPDSQQPQDIIEIPPGPRGPRLGVDEWVARREGRREYLPSWLGRAERESERIGCWAGLLDLGYVAFFGAGAYGYALLSSNQLGTSGIHLPAYFSVPIVMIGAALLGLGVGLPSRRLIGDYLAIITLFFGEAFVEFTNNVA